MESCQQRLSTLESPNPHFQFHSAEVLSPDLLGTLLRHPPDSSCRRDAIPAVASSPFPFLIAAVGHAAAAARSSIRRVVGPQ
ncbi:hypothetical protein Ahy_A03g015131 isoform B [Arachis hypogaea]|uniref:Uncharacterized protein n=1 Tax=Arachis hypogaea TaxID=3818 RepID=A0A445DZY9_ARAHY|nr:hypothetical protein Ahy_A03g015131 isoform B [Arachis hypogaea]